MWPPSELSLTLYVSLSLIQTTLMERGTGVTGQRAVSPVGMAIRREPGRVVMLVQPPSPVPVICPAAQVKAIRLDSGLPLLYRYGCAYENTSSIVKIAFKGIGRCGSKCMRVLVWSFDDFHPLINHLPCIHLSTGIEDAFKTAATEVSLLAGTDEFNATELFGVGKILSVLVLLPQSDGRAVKDSSSIWQQCTAQYSCAHLAFLILWLCPITVQRWKCSAGQEEHSTLLLLALFASVCSQSSQSSAMTKHTFSHTLHLHMLLFSSSNMRRGVLGRRCSV